MARTGPGKPKSSVRRSNGVLSVETAFSVLRPLLDAREARPLSALAAGSGMPAAKVHRYLVSLIKVGMVVQDASSGRYDLGPLALHLGLASLDRFDPVRYAVSAAAQLRDEIDETVSIVVWGDAGPTVVRTENSTHEVTLTMRVGTVLPLTASASGMLFLSHLPAPETAGLLAPKGRTGRRVTATSLAALQADARRRGLTRTVGGVLPGVSAIAAPIFTEGATIAGAVTAYGRSATFDTTWDGRIANALRRFATELSSIRRPKVH
jgi:DNA-binding IclR family transcriptional regulator